MQNKKLREKLNNRNKHNIIKTTKEEIVDYWIRIQDECVLSVDWAEAKERCWRCGYEANLQRCHIIPESLGGKDEPSNLVLLCSRCHIDAPNVESKNLCGIGLERMVHLYTIHFGKLELKKNMNLFMESHFNKN